MHLRILLLEEIDVLVRGLIVVEESTDARLLLVFVDLLSEDLQFKLHEMNLLLQVYDVIFRLVVIIRVATKGYTRAALLLLAIEFDHLSV